MSLLEAEDVAPARSPCSTSRTESPRPTASRAMPVPLIPPPTISRSTAAGSEVIDPSPSPALGAERLGEVGKSPRLPSYLLLPPTSSCSPALKGGGDWPAPPPTLHDVIERRVEQVEVAQAIGKAFGAAIEDEGNALLGKTAVGAERSVEAREVVLSGAGA